MTAFMPGVAVAPDAGAPVLPGFEHMRRYWDPTCNCMTVKLLPGEFYVSTQEEMVSTVLGSCVSACISDSERRIGGMNHFMLPEPMSGERNDWSVAVGRAARYGSDAMEQLINAILKAGGRRETLRVKIFGGGRVLSHMTDVGQSNISFVRQYLETERLMLVAADVGDIYPRQLQFFPASGRVRVRQLRSARDAELSANEQRYLKRLANDPIKGEVELF